MLPRISLRQRSTVFYLIIFLWFLVYSYHILLAPKSSALTCHWPKSKHKTHHIMFVADPQLIDNHTYPSYNPLFLSITKHTVDQYLKRNFKALSKNLKPNSIIFLGDYLDNGRSSSDLYYSKEFERFNSIFKDYNKVGANNFITTLSGNHDIGWKNGIKLSSLERFEKSFGDPVPYEISNVLFVPLNTLAISNTENLEISSKPKKILNEISNLNKDKPRILLSHVPLMRDKSQSCGELRESSNFPFDAGYQYQTVLDDELSKEILMKIKPDLIYSGDDHDYCFVNHEYYVNDIKYNANEITVKSISMAMGIHKPAVELLTIIDKNNDNRIFDNDKIDLISNICFLPIPYNDIITYIFTAIISGLIIIINSYLMVFRQKYSRIPNNINHNKTNNNNSIFKKLRLFFNPKNKKESPYSSNNLFDTFQIDLDDPMNDNLLTPINSYRKRAKTRVLHYNSQKVNNSLMTKFFIIIFTNFLFFGSLATLMYFFFLFLV